MIRSSRGTYRTSAVLVDGGSRECGLLFEQPGVLIDGLGEIVRQGHDQCIALLVRSSHVWSGTSGQISLTKAEACCVNSAVDTLDSPLLLTSSATATHP